MLPHQLLIFGSLACQSRSLLTGSGPGSSEEGVTV